MSEAFAKAWGEFQAAPHDETPCRQAFKAGWDALAELLGNEHYVTYSEDGWVVEHSLDCRLAGTLGTCNFNEAAGEMGPNLDDEFQLGRYRMFVKGHVTMVLESVNAGD